MYKYLFIDNYSINNVNDFESWLKEECNFDKFECEVLREMYDEELQASWYAECYKDAENEKCWYEDYVWNIRNEIVNVIEDMQERLTGKESRNQLASLLDLVESL